MDVRALDKPLSEDQPECGASFFSLPAKPRAPGVQPAAASVTALQVELGPTPAGSSRPVPPSDRGQRKVLGLIPGPGKGLSQLSELSLPILPRAVFQWDPRVYKLDGEQRALRVL